MFVKPYSEGKHQLISRSNDQQSQFQTFRNREHQNLLQNQDEDVLLMKIRIEQLEREIAGAQQRSSNLQKQNQRLNHMILRNNTREEKRTQHFIEKLTYLCGNMVENKHRSHLSGGGFDAKRKECQINSRKSSSKKKAHDQMNSFGKTKTHYPSTYNDENNSFIGNTGSIRGKNYFRKMINQKLSSTNIK